MSEQEKGPLKPEPTHPDAQAAERLFQDAERQQNWALGRQAFNKLKEATGTLELVLDGLIEHWGRKGDAKATATDSAPLERVATAAIKLAEQVVTAFTQERKVE